VRRWLLCAVVLTLALAAGCRRDQVRLQVGRTGEGFEWRDPISASEFRRPAEALLYDVRPPVGYATARQQSGERFVMDARLRWNDLILPLCASYDRLGRAHNDARLTVCDFQEQEAALAGMSRSLAVDRDDLDKGLEAFLSAQDALAQIRVEGAPDTRIQAAQRNVAAARQRVAAVIERTAHRLEAFVGHDDGKSPRAEEAAEPFLRIFVSAMAWPRPLQVAPLS